MSRLVVPLMVWALCGASALYAETFEGRVVGVADGDTLTLLAEDRQPIRIRLSGIDAPEKAQPFGQHAKAALSQLAFNRLAIADCHKQDRYRRWICTVEVNGRDVGRAQLDAGLAWWYRGYQKEQPLKQRLSYEEAEIRAQEARAGLWSNADALPPWEWRRALRNSR